ncbi:V4R domain-containing protein [Nannocystis exedens]|uniref:V4R domain-containing protein n=1 Tax=Nannocystis exedens TaxID=54 RepID=A0A1I1Y8Q6_9BACT|nr:V4R domain-containing protein [Nannocystis exedens]PCC71810.1 V4R domain protein [Nannocystis exedens]SFE14503.1 V4R domain-containing protein [Nannocystis exedens]
MAIDSDLAARLAMQYEPATYRRRIAGHDVIIHCHHYNARLQRTIEGARGIDGKGIIVGAAETVFADQLARALRPDDDEARRWAVAELLYRHLGFGRIDLSQVGAGIVTADSSHFVEGWLAGLGESADNVCSFTEGYVQGAVYAVTGAAVRVREVECMARGAERCRFEVDRGERPPVTPNRKEPPIPAPREPGAGWLRSPHVDEQAIIDAVVGMPMVGDDAGLIPAFSVYLANMPADFYNRICIGFVEAMRGLGRDKTAIRLLVSDAEHCGMNTFRGIMHSPEWDGLIAPMVRDRADALHAIIAISNALGWGDWHVTAHTPRSLALESRYGYEAVGYREFRGLAAAPQCAMLTGVAAGVMELVYGEGTVEERYGTFSAREERCVSCGEASCNFAVEQVE